VDQTGLLAPAQRASISRLARVAWSERASFSRNHAHRVSLDRGFNRLRPDELDSKRWDSSPGRRERIPGVGEESRTLSRSE
jgi:hypothetical protein